MTKTTATTPRVVPVLFLLALACSASTAAPFAYDTCRNAA